MGLRNVVEMSIQASASEGQMSERRAMTRALEPGLKRIAARAIDEMVFFGPTLRNDLYMYKNNMKRVGSGAEATVIRIGDNVIKVVRNSELLTESERVKMAEKKQDEFEKLVGFLSPFVLPQSIEAGAHPYRKDSRAVLTHQAHIAYTSLLSVDQGTSTVSVAHLSSGPIKDGLSDFVDGAWRLYGNTGLLPDMNGRDNIVNSHGVVLLDTQPISANNPGVQAVIKSQLHSIEAILADAH